MLPYSPVFFSENLLFFVCRSCVAWDTSSAHFLLAVSSGLGAPTYSFFLLSFAWIRANSLIHHPGPPSWRTFQRSYFCSEERGSGRDLWGDMSEDIWVQPSLKSFTGPTRSIIGNLFVTNRTVLMLPHSITAVLRAVQSQFGGVAYHCWHEHFTLKPFPVRLAGYWLHI